MNEQFGWTGQMDAAGYRAMKTCVRAILEELAGVNMPWHEYPTLVDAIEQHVETALLTPNMQCISLSGPASPPREGA
jgi:hypothetical protein